MLGELFKVFALDNYSREGEWMFWVGSLTTSLVALADIFHTALLAHSDETADGLA